MGITHKLTRLDKAMHVWAIKKKKEMKENNKMAVKFEMGSEAHVCVCVWLKQSQAKTNKDKQRLNRD